MADLTKLKRKGSLGAPPPAAEASTNLRAPETAPPIPLPLTPVEMPSELAGEDRRFRDGRSARRTGRTVQFATRVSPEFDERLRSIADRDGLLLVEVLERALDAYDKEKGR